MDDVTDMALATVTGVSVIACFATVLLTTLFPCSCNPRRDCKRNCADCKRDREKCRRKCCARERASTEEELTGMV